MLSKTFITLASLLAAVSALQITEPALNDKLDFSGTNTIEWTSVSSDPTSFEIVLLDNSATPPTQKTIADSVKTSDGKYSFTNFVTPVGTKYQINLVGSSKTNSGILAQSQQFEVTKSGVEPTTTTSATPSATSAAAATATQSTNAAVPLGKTFGVSAPILAALAMLF
ncbi:hypothetical protein NKR23_g6614 [Pleurostoma richardsiae]|uniref:Yeast cell wall synthesis Kre9/Knh1-like N-terminal domain-containing protein n=1 Tax=Pleurostoma richardsiae TaxID=41990 RepID=A0AA38RQE2_9PEZI|nr:hypothetical protein NKR23_g6614 [Pleurostoma richardsiae]